MADRLSINDTRTGNEHELSLSYGTHVNAGSRSEERRVGKECRSRWSPYH